MLIYGYFSPLPIRPWPQPARTWSGVKYAWTHFEHFAKKLDHADAIGFIYRGEPTGDEERLGYPDLPDWLFSADNGKLIKRKLT